MTTSDQPDMLSIDELEALRRHAREPGAVDAQTVQALVAKGVLQHDEDGGAKLTPAGAHALDVNHDPPVPGIDN